MPEAMDTPTGETVAEVVNGTDTTDVAATETTEVTEPQVTPTPAELEDLRKQNNKLQMEINQRRNKERELEEARAKAERERIEKESDAQVQADFYRKQLEEREAADAQREADAEAERQAKEVETFRDKIIADYPEAVQDLAKKLGTNWDDAADYDTAETQLRAKLDLLKGAVNPAEVEADAPEYTANNPRPEIEPTEIDKLRKLTAAEMRKILPVASGR